MLYDDIGNPIKGGVVKKSINFFHTTGGCANSNDMVGGGALVNM